MEQPSGHTLATVLRTVGRVLDINEARTAWIAQDDDAVRLRWGSGAGTLNEAQYTWEDLDLLDQVARMNRVTGRNRTPVRSRFTSGWSQILRTLGQDLEEVEAESSRIEGDMTWLSISWRNGQRVRSRQYTAAELQAANKRRATERRPNA